MTGEGITAEVVVVIPTLREQERLWRTIRSVKRSLQDTDHTIVVVVNDPSYPPEVRPREGVFFRGAGLNLGWAAGLHAGLLGTASDLVWAIQDDMTVQAPTFARLRGALRSDPRLGVVRPTPSHQRPSKQSDVSATRVVPVDAQAGEHLPSSGQLIRRVVWESVGGYEPLLWPWGYIDVDFTRSLTEAGWTCAHVTDAIMHHRAGGSTNWNLRAHALARNDELYRFKWDDALERPALVAPAIIAEARRMRGRPRVVSLETLQQWVGLAATDAYASVMMWLPNEPYEALRRLAHDPASRRAFGYRVSAAVKKRVQRLRLHVKDQ